MTALVIAAILLASTIGVVVAILRSKTQEYRQADGFIDLLKGGK